MDEYDAGFPQWDTAQKQIAVSHTQQQTQASRDLLVSNQIAKGFEELGQEQLGLRVGGLFELEGVMKISKQYHQPILETLTLFVRITNMAGIACPPLPGGAQSPSVDIEVALTILGRRDHRLDAGDGADLHGAKICGADLNHAHFEGDQFDQAHLEGANFTDAHLDRARLNGAYLEDVHFDDATLTGADLTGATLNANTIFTGADMKNTDLSDVNLSGTDISDAQVSAACGAGIIRPTRHLQTTPRACPPDH